MTTNHPQTVNMEPFAPPTVACVATLVIHTKMHIIATIIIFYYNTHYYDNINH